MKKVKNKCKFKRRKNIDQHETTLVFYFSMTFYLTNVQNVTCSNINQCSLGHVRCSVGVL